MRLRTAVFAILALPAIGLAQAPGTLPESAHQALEQKLAPLATKYPGVTFTLPRNEETNGWAKLNYKPVQDVQDANAYVMLFLEEFAKYPQDFIKNCGLKSVQIVERLAIGSQFRAAVPDYVNEVLYYDVSYVKNQRYTRHVVHHEFFHMLEQEWNADAYYKDPKWAELNEKDFNYGPGGAEAYGRGDVWSFIHPRPGFLNIYSMYGIEEDKAEAWAVMFVPDNWKLAKPFVDADPILRAKLAYLRAFAQTKSPEMIDAYWTSLVNKGALSSHPMTQNERLASEEHLRNHASTATRHSRGSAEGGPPEWSEDEITFSEGKTRTSSGYRRGKWGPARPPVSS